MSTATPTHESQRRSTRIRLEIPVVLTSLNPEASFSEPCQTLVVNPQGCGLRFNRPLEIGALVGIEKLPGARRASGRVANCLPIGSNGDFWLIGVALDEPGNVWGVAQPPADWGTPKSVAATASAGVSTAKKSKEWPFSQYSTRGEFHPGRK
jgi:hypothetical protein